MVFPGFIKENISLRPYNTFGTEASSAYFSTVHSVDDVRKVIHTGIPKLFPVFILGSGSNVLFTRDFPGLVLLCRIEGIKTTGEADDQVTVEAGAGVEWDRFVQFCVSHDYHGTENLSLIPGTVGAAAVQNIGAYGTEVAALIEEVKGTDLRDGSRKTFTRRQCRFGYRDSVFKHFKPGTFLITSVVFRLPKKGSANLTYPALAQELKKSPHPSPAIIREAVIRIRRSKLPDPQDTGNAGSFFKNPVVSREVFEKIRKDHPDLPFHVTEEELFKLPAAWLIEQAGWKGVREGDCGTWPRQPLVIVNYGRATGGEIDRFAGKIAATVKEKFGISLQREVITI